MFLKKVALVFLIVLSIIGSSYFIAGCNADREQVREIIRTIIDGLKPPSGNIFYISHVSFFDRYYDTGNSLFTSSRVKLLNNAMISGINELTKTEPQHYKYNVYGHSLPDRADLSRKFKELTLSENQTTEEKGHIARGIASRYGVTTVVTGTYWQNKEGDIVVITPLVYHNGDITSKEVKEYKSKVFCQHYFIGEKLCPDLGNKITTTVKELLSDLNR